eukprot:8036715-Ditylum_brightwellii.AAC.1
MVLMIVLKIVMTVPTSNSHIPHKQLIVIQQREASKTCMLMVIMEMALVIVLKIVMTVPTNNSHI